MSYPDYNGATEVIRAQSDSIVDRTFETLQRMNSAVSEAEKFKDTFVAQVSSMTLTDFRLFLERIS